MKINSSKEAMDPLFDLLQQLAPQEPSPEVKKLILQKVAIRKKELQQVSTKWLLVAAAVLIGLLSLNILVVKQHQKSYQAQLLNQMIDNSQNQLYHE
jgi:hypothetical protein